MAENPYKTIEDLILGVKEDFEKFYEKDNQAAGTRIRKAMQDLKTIAHDTRKEVQEMKNSRSKPAEEVAKPAAKAPKAAPAKKTK
jgi:hypothetical protein